MSSPIDFSEDLKETCAHMNVMIRIFWVQYIKYEYFIQNKYNLGNLLKKRIRNNKLKQ